MTLITRGNYAKSYGPTVGDQIRLGDTSLWIEITHDLTFGGDEAVFGGGKTIRESMLQGTTTSSEGAPDTVITNVVILDVAPAQDLASLVPDESANKNAIVRADVGIKDGKIAAIGKAGNSDVMAGVTPGLEIGTSTDVISGEGKILTAGAIDTHVHYISPSAVTEALATGTTTLVGGGVGPSEGSKATTVTPGPQHLVNLHRSFDDLPVNVMLLGKGNTVSEDGLDEQALAGAGGYKIHEDWGATPAALDAALKAGEKWGLQVALHADSLNEAGFSETTLDAIDGRGIHVFHAEGSRRRARPRHPEGGRQGKRIARFDEPDSAVHGEHRGRAHRHAGLRPPPGPGQPERPGLRRLPYPLDDHVRRRRTARHGRHVHHLLRRPGYGPYRRGRDPHLAGRTRHEGVEPQDLQRERELLLRGRAGEGDNARALRYVAKYTINPAIAHGIDDYVGSVKVEKLADLVLWDPRFFAVRPEVVIKGGAMVLGNLGDPNGSVSTPQPTFLRPAMAHAIASQVSYAFVSDKALNPSMRR